MKFVKLKGVRKSMKKKYEDMKFIESTWKFWFGTWKWNKKFKQWFFLKTKFFLECNYFSFIWHRKWLKWTTFEVCEPQRCAQKHEEQLCGHKIHRIYLKILIWDMKMKEKWKKRFKQWFFLKTKFFLECNDFFIYLT